MIKNYSETSDISRDEVFRYARCFSPQYAEEQLLDECIEICSDSISYGVLYDFCSVDITDNRIKFPFCKIESESLAKHLFGYDRVCVFVATIGYKIDGLIRKYSTISPAKGYMLSAIGSERVEALCDRFCSDLSKEFLMTKRFSPGYGDLDLSFQSPLLESLKAEKYLGVYLSDGLLMSPEKTVSAIVGIKEK